MTNKNYCFYRCQLEKGMASEGKPRMLAATEVVQAVCSAGFRENGFLIKDYPSIPHYYFKFAKTPKEGMFKLRAVKKTDLTTLDILIDTRIFPHLIMMEQHQDWKEETAEVSSALEHIMNNAAEKQKWRIHLKEHRPGSTQNLPEFLSALDYMEDDEDMIEKHGNHIQIGQLIKVNGNYYYGDMLKKAESAGREQSESPQKEPSEELFHFIHPSLDDEEGWNIHNEVKRLVAHHGIQEICNYLKQLANDKKILLPQSAEKAYIELRRMGMPDGEGFGKKYFMRYYNK